MSDDMHAYIIYVCLMTFTVFLVNKKKFKNTEGSLAVAYLDVANIDYSVFTGYFGNFQHVCIDSRQCFGTDSNCTACRASAQWN